MSQIISPRNLYSKISEFLFLFNHIHEFLQFYLFIFTGVYTLGQTNHVESTSTRLDLNYSYNFFYSKNNIDT